MPTLTPLRNRYALLRHGQSLANLEGVIVSSPAIGVANFGLSELGRSEVHASITDTSVSLDEVRVIYASDFLRTRETADIVAQHFDVPVELATPLRERHFGELDGKSSDNYQRVWDRDATDPGHETWGVESVRAVAARMSAFLQQLEQQHRGEQILLVSHGDPLQILITDISGADLRRHRVMDSIRTAELRTLVV